MGSVHPYPLRGEIELRSHVQHGSRQLAFRRSLGRAGEGRGTPIIRDSQSERTTAKPPYCRRLSLTEDARRGLLHLTELPPRCHSDIKSGGTMGVRTLRSRSILGVSLFMNVERNWLRPDDSFNREEHLHLSGPAGVGAPARQRHPFGQLPSV